VIYIRSTGHFPEIAVIRQSDCAAISYEDVALIYSGDYARALDTDWGRKYAEQNAQFKAANRFGLVGGSLDIHVAIDPASARPVLPVTQILEDVIEQHKARGNPGQFELLAIEDGFAIIPMVKRDATGMLIPEYSPLDSAISFPLAVRSGAETLKVISALPKMSWHLLCGPNRPITTAPSLADVSCALNLGTVQ